MERRLSLEHLLNFRSNFVAQLLLSKFFLLLLIVALTLYYLYLRFHKNLLHIYHIIDPILRNLTQISASLMLCHMCNKNTFCLPFGIIYLISPCLVLLHRRSFLCLNRRQSHRIDRLNHLRRILYLIARTSFAESFPFIIFFLYVEFFRLILDNLLIK